MTIDNEQLTIHNEGETVNLIHVDFDDDFDDSYYEQAAEQIYDNGGYNPEMLSTQKGSALINETFRVFNTAIDKGLGEEPDPAVSAALRENAFIFSGFKTHAELEQVSQMLTDEKGNIKPFNEFLNDIQSINQDYNHNYLRTEYNQALQAAQMAGKWADFEKNKNFINLQYRTANDERVRASHRILHGTTLPVDDPFWKQYTPPNGWGCRCTVVAVLKDDYPVQDRHGSIAKAESCFKTPKEKMFKENLAEKKRLFPSKHPYLPKQNCNGCDLKGEIGLSVNGKLNCPYRRACKSICEAKKICDKKDAKKENKAREKIEKQNKKMETIKKDIQKSSEQFSNLKPIECIPEMVEYNKKQYQQYDENWRRMFFEPLNGGYVVCHVEHQYTPNKGGGNAEIKVAYLLAHVSGKEVEILPENGQGKKLPDLRFDGYTWDVKKIDEANEGSIDTIIRDTKKAERIIFYWENDNNQLERIKSIIAHRQSNALIYYFTPEGRLKHIQ